MDILIAFTLGIMGIGISFAMAHLTLRGIFGAMESLAKSRAKA